jgi:hypothetical protein
MNNLFYIFNGNDNEKEHKEPTPFIGRVYELHPEWY